MRVNQISRLTNQILEQYFADKDYDPSKCLDWTQEVADLVLEKINSPNGTENEPNKYKYIVICSIQKQGAGLQSSSACLWNSSTDVATCVKFEFKEINCAVNIYAIAYD